jgi:hypothetical protein
MIDIADYLNTAAATGAMATVFSIPLIFMWNILRFDKASELREHKLRDKITLVLFNIAFELFLIIKRTDYIQNLNTFASFLLYSSLGIYILFHISKLSKLV